MKLTQNSVEVLGISRYIVDRLDIRFGKARLLLKETSQTVEAIAAEVGYENVEHFNRLFKKTYGCTPMQYRSSK